MPAAERIHCLIDKLAVDSSKTYTGLDWEVIVQVAILLRCLGAYFRDNDLQFLGGYGTTTVAGVECITIPREYQTLDDAHAYMVEECIRTTRSAAANVFFVTPQQFSSFPDYDAFLLVKDSDVTTYSNHLLANEIDSKISQPTGALVDGGSIPDPRGCAHSSGRLKREMVILE
jgi:hypothetical protein